MPFLVTAALLLGPAFSSQSQEEGRGRVDRLVMQAELATRQKKHAKAYELYKLVHRLDDKRPGILGRLGITALRIGGGFYKDKEWARAIRMFQEATRWTPRDPRVWQSLATALYRAEKFADCEKALRKVVELDSRSFHALLHLGVILQDRQEYQEAIGFLERALRIHPEDPMARKLYQKAIVDGRLESSFRGKSSSHFMLRYNGEKGPLEKHAAEISEFLEKSHGELSQLFNHVVSKKIVVLLYTRTEFAKTPHKADWAGAYYDGKVRVPLDSWPGQTFQVKRTIRHELTHAFLSDLVPHASSWLQEGFAQWVEGVSVSRSRNLLRHGPLAGASKLRERFLRVKDADAVRRLYAQSLALFVHLMDARGLREMQMFLRRIRSGEGSYAQREDRALRKTYGKDLQGLIRELAERHHLPDPGR
ncbi:MAG: tetratricopeptide repeat protein [Planctomycetota bacterium]